MAALRVADGDAAAIPAHQEQQHQPALRRPYSEYRLEPELQAELDSALTRESASEGELHERALMYYALCHQICTISLLLQITSCLRCLQRAYAVAVQAAGAGCIWWSWAM